LRATPTRATVRSLPVWRSNTVAHLRFYSAHCCATPVEIPARRSVVRSITSSPMEARCDPAAPLPAPDGCRLRGGGRDRTEAHHRSIAHRRRENGGLCRDRQARGRQVSTRTGRLAP